MIVEVNGLRYAPAFNKVLKVQKFNLLLRAARKASGESLEEVAKSVGSTKSYMWELERGPAQPTLGLLQRLLWHYGLEFEQIAPIGYTRGRHEPQSGESNG